jgi:hypothetical protein
MMMVGHVVREVRLYGVFHTMEINFQAKPFDKLTKFSESDKKFLNVFCR